jgi:hypothetical protein
MRFSLPTVLRASTTACGGKSPAPQVRRAGIEVTATGSRPYAQSRGVAGRRSRSAIQILAVCPSVTVPRRSRRQGRRVLGTRFASCGRC